MKNPSLRYRALAVVTLVLVAAAGCGGSESSDTAGNGDTFAFDASAYKPKPGSTTDTTGGNAGANGLAPPGPNCGDPTVNPDEQCDGTNLGGKTCATATMGASPNGTLACRSNCTFDLTGCSSNGTQGSNTGGGSNGTGGGDQGTGAGPNTGAGGGP